MRKGGAQDSDQNNNNPLTLTNKRYSAGEKEYSMGDFVNPP